MMRTPSNTKRSPPIGSDPLNRRLIATVEERFASANARDKATAWRLRKKNPTELGDLIKIARNLDIMLDSLPHGGKVRALAAAGFGGDDQSGYRGNLTVPIQVDHVDELRLRRLTPHVQRYLAVAQAIEPDRDRAIHLLFAGTSLDHFTGGGNDVDWADRLSRVLSANTAKINAELGLGELYDRLSQANVFLGEDAGITLKATDWLSETFHKFDFAERPGDGSWMYDRNDDQTPRCGAALFSPKIALASKVHSWQFDVRTLTDRGGNSLEHPDRITVHATATLHLALVPVAPDLEAPAGVEPWLLLRPHAQIEAGQRSNVQRIRADADGLTLWNGAGAWTLLDPHGFRHSDSAKLLVDQTDKAAENPDLSNGSWWCLPASGENVRRQLGQSWDHLLLQAPPPHRNLSPVIDEAADLEQVDFHALDPGIYAPSGSVATALQNAIATRQLKSLFETEIVKLRTAYADLHHQLRSACPIAIAMLGQ
jgi:hypothetical protein